MKTWWCFIGCFIKYQDSSTWSKWLSFIGFWLSNVDEFENFCSQQVFSGNSNADGVVRNRISSPFHCTAVRIRAINWKDRTCMRSELYGCEAHSWAAEKRQRQPLAKLSDRKSVVIIMELLVRSYAGRGRPRNLGNFQGNLQSRSQSSSAISDTWRHLSFLSWCFAHRTRFQASSAHSDRAKDQFMELIPSKWGKWKTRYMKTD